MFSLQYESKWRGLAWRLNLDLGHSYLEIVIELTVMNWFNCQKGVWLFGVSEWDWILKTGICCFPGNNKIRIPVETLGNICLLIDHSLIFF